MNGMTPEASASTTTSKIKIGARKSGRLDAGTEAETSLGVMVSRSGVSQMQDFAPEVLAAKRAALLEEKQVTLEQVVDKHDDFVCFLSLEWFWFASERLRLDLQLRELFHMQQFTMMLLYDPVVCDGSSLSDYF